MIDYDPGRWGLHFICGIHGSVFPKAFMLALPNAVLCGVLFYVWRDSEDQDEEMKNEFDGFVSLWGGYTSILGFLLVFRNNQAYGRLWEGAGLLNQVRGEWFNATSNLISFCSKDPSRREDVKNFQEILIRLMSMLHCHALGQICDFVKSDTLEVLCTDGFDERSLEFVAHADNSVEVVLQWVQQLIVDAHSSGVVTIAPPILSRAFQELSRGIVSFQNARKIKDLPFPFPYAQLIAWMLIVHWFVTPVLACRMLRTWYWAAIICFCLTFAIWCLTYIALEMDQPFGEDPNDLPFREKQQEFNRGLLMLLEPETQSPPRFNQSDEGGERHIKFSQIRVKSRTWGPCDSKISVASGVSRHTKVAPTNRSTIRRTSSDLDRVVQRADSKDVEEDDPAPEPRLSLLSRRSTTASPFVFENLPAAAYADEEEDVAMPACPLARASARYEEEDPASSSRQTSNSLRQSSHAGQHSTSPRSSQYRAVIRARISNQSQETRLQVPEAASRSNDAAEPKGNSSSSCTSVDGSPRRTAQLSAPAADGVPSGTLQLPTSAGDCVASPSQTGEHTAEGPSIGVSSLPPRDVVQGAPKVDDWDRDRGPAHPDHGEADGNESFVPGLLT